MKAHKFFNVLMVVFFILVISVPLIAVNKTPGKISITENRVLANFPDFRTPEGKLNIHFIKDFESWFNDNLGFRDKFVQANTKIQYDLFGRLTRTDVLLGKNNWLYYVTPEILKDYQQLNLPTNQELNDWRGSLEKVSTYLNKKNIPFIVMLNPDKKTIYPENYPDTILKVGDTSRTELIEKNFSTNADLNFFTPIEALLQAKNKATLYSPRYDNGHWNSYGAFIGYTELMKRVQKYFPDIKVFTADDFEINEYERVNKIYNAIPFSETDLSFDFKNQRSAQETYGVLDNLNLSTKIMSASYLNSNMSLPKALILGDSYLYGFMTPNLAESFSETIFVYSDNIDKIRFLVDYFKPDIVIYENVERSFEKTMGILSSTTEFIDYSTFKNLPVEKIPATMWLDYFNNEVVQDQGVITLDKSINGTVSFSGWALDPKNNDVASDIFLKVGEKYYSGSYGASRTSVSDYYNNPDLTNSGFSFNLDATELMNVDKVSFVVISKDETYQYAPVDFKVVLK